MSQWNIGNVIQLLLDNGMSDTSTKFTRQYRNILTSAFGEVERIGSEWTFMKRHTTLTFAAPYETGTVSVNVDGTTVTGAGTTFTSAMAKRWIRFDGEAQQYLIDSFTSTTAVELAGDGYQGDANLSGVSYSITEESKELPKLFGKFVKGAIDETPYNLTPLSDFNDLVVERMRNQTVSQPQKYAIEWRGPQSSWTTARASAGLQTSEIALPYLWLYPIPSAKYILTFGYYERFPDIQTGFTTGSTQTLPFPNNSSISAFMDMCLAYLAKEQKESDWMAKREDARRSLREALGTFKDVTHLEQREAWTPDGEGQAIVKPWEFNVN